MEEMSKPVTGGSLEKEEEVGIHAWIACSVSFSCPVATEHLDEFRQGSQGFNPCQSFRKSEEAQGEGRHVCLHVLPVSSQPAPPGWLETGKGTEAVMPGFPAPASLGCGAPEGAWAGKSGILLKKVSPQKRSGSGQKAGAGGGACHHLGCQSSAPAHSGPKQPVLVSKFYTSKYYLTVNLP
ncbi:UNVERIFIED_CONTAM: hypothetical protein K2H54_065243 [Gekko kuhli]